MRKIVTFLHFWFLAVLRNLFSSCLARNDMMLLISLEYYIRLVLLVTMGREQHSIGFNLLFCPIVPGQRLQHSVRAHATRTYILCVRGFGSCQVIGFFAPSFLSFLYLSWYLVPFTGPSSRWVALCEESSSHRYLSTTILMVQAYLCKKLVTSFIVGLKTDKNKHHLGTKNAQKG